MRHAKSWISLVLAQALCAGTAIAAPDTTNEKIWNLVEQGAAHVQAVGPEKAFHDFADKNGKWQQGGLYVSVVGFDGKIVVDGENKSRVGKNIVSVTDSTGRPYGKELVTLVKDWGYSGVEYATIDPATGKSVRRTACGTVLPYFNGILAVGTKAGVNVVTASRDVR